MRKIRNESIRPGSIKEHDRGAAKVSLKGAIGGKVKKGTPSLPKARSGGHGRHPVIGRVKEARSASHINNPRVKDNADGYQSQARPFGKSGVGVTGNPRHIGVPRQKARNVSVKVTPSMGSGSSYRGSGPSQKRIGVPRLKSKDSAYSLNANRQGKGIQSGSLSAVRKSPRLV